MTGYYDLPISGVHVCLHYKFYTCESHISNLWPSFGPKVWDFLESRTVYHRKVQLKLRACLSKDETFLRVWHVTCTHVIVTWSTDRERNPICTPTPWPTPIRPVHTVRAGSLSCSVVSSIADCELINRFLPTPAPLHILLNKPWMIYTWFLNETF